jgi:hypothetical protein
MATTDTDTTGVVHTSTKCVCLEGFVEDMTDPMTCTATDMPTFAPTEVEGEAVDSPTAAPTWYFPKGYCADTNQRIAFWVIPMTEHAKCPEATLTSYQTIEYTPNADPLLPPTRVVNDPYSITEEVCMEICARTLGGPRGNCTYMDYDEDGACWISDTCGWHSEAADTTPDDFHEDGVPGNRAGMEHRRQLTSEQMVQRRRQLYVDGVDYHSWGKRAYKNDVLNLDGDMTSTYDNPLSWDAGESIGIEMIHCEFIDSEAKTCVNSKVENQVELPHLTDCFDECRASPSCLYYTYDENSGTCELFQFCDGYTGAPFGSNQRLYMMSDDLNFPQTSDQVIATGEELSVPLFPPDVLSATAVDEEVSSHGDGDGDDGAGSEGEEKSSGEGAMAMHGRRTTATSFSAQRHHAQQQPSAGQDSELKQANLQMAQEMSMMKQALAVNKQAQERLQYLVFALSGVGVLMGWSMTSKSRRAGGETSSAHQQQHELARRGAGSYRNVNPALENGFDSI